LLALAKVCYPHHSHFVAYGEHIIEAGSRDERLLLLFQGLKGTGNTAWITIPVRPGRRVADTGHELL